MAAAIDAQTLVGFASAVHYVHPDKPPELWINEVSVAATHRRRGIGKQLLRALFAAAEDLGCGEAWVLADPDNLEAARLYGSAGGRPVATTMFNFKPSAAVADHAAADANGTLAMTANEAFPMDGGCTCRTIRYRMMTPPLFVHCCHCRWCQRESGASFALNALIEADRVVLLQGEVVIVDTPSNSGKGQKIARCPTCRIAVWSNYAGAGDALRFVRVGTLDDPDRFPPDIHIFTASKQSWIVLPPNILAVAEYYKASELWPKESLERRAILLAKS
jgi:hypothetical protein